MCMPVAPVFLQPIQGRYQLGQTITSFCHVLTSLIITMIKPSFRHDNYISYAASGVVYKKKKYNKSLRWKTAFLKRNQGTNSNIFIYTSQEDDDVSLSCKDCKFLYIMETGVQKNDQENWKMPLAFHCRDPHLPNNQSQAINRLNGLFYALKRKLRWQKAMWSS